MVVHKDNWKEVSAGTLGEALGIEWVSATDDKIIFTMPVGPNTRQPMGLLHGGASVALAETVASIGGVNKVAPLGKTAVGLEINANHIRSKRDGMVTAIGSLIHEGRTTMIWEVKIVDESDKLICISRCTLAIVDVR
ncbi:hotdog fold thioesterase [Hazenella sp. IB182357]|uniref:Hotdog fold thioesterase n=1 Tax=Polycladospora coralii TaxID=2771432 RepID=A0A926NEM7_9BACL|nr:hotdog fold thioesterase [Polycladospora coralii]MBD1372033.1 hotdog fold thioesterase [Polycladospora coralii]